MKRLNLALALHNHQPAGNFGWVLEQLYTDSYAPMVGCLERHPRIHIALHYSGFLLDWLAEHHPDFIERVAALSSRGQVEVMGGAYFEPVLPAIPDRDKRSQMIRLADAVERWFGRRPTGLWLAERVWEPSLARPLAEAGYRYTILDDSHFERAGLSPEELFTPFLTEDQGHRLTLLATGTKMRYLIPWRSVKECLEYFRASASEESRLVLMGDDGEKFGGWPTTGDLCWKQGWVERFFEMLEAESGWLDTVLPREYLDRHPPRGPVYLPAGSYPEMLRWSGGFWRNFMSRYPEVNAMHKKMLLVSDKVAEAGAPDAAVTFLQRGQANDAYWHGVFGGIYLPHLRRAVWQNLVAAESAVTPSDGRTRRLRRDYDHDGHLEELVETPSQNAYLAPAAGGAVVEWDVRGRNAVDCLARREEPYHQRLREGGAGSGVSRLEEPLRVRERGLEKRLHYDQRRRLVFQAYLATVSASAALAHRSRLAELGSFAAGIFSTGRGRSMERVETILKSGRTTRVRMLKSFRVDDLEPVLEMRISLEGEGGPLDALLLVEVNLGLAGGVDDGTVAGLALDRPADLGPRTRVTLRQPKAGIEYQLTLPGGSSAWYYPVETVNNSESGYERIVQGACLVAVHPVRLGSEPVRFRFRLEATA